jgi:CheY-like chemotaxis protein
MPRAGDFGKQNRRGRPNHSGNLREPALWQGLAWSDCFSRKNLVFEPMFPLLTSTCRPMHQELFTQVAGAGAGATAPAPATSAPGESPQPRPRARLPLHILAADDVRTNRSFIRQLAGYFGYEAELVENGAEVLAALGRGSFDLVLLDLHMPVMDGLEAAREIVRLQPDPSRRPRMVALTAEASADDRKACLAAGMDDCLVKPFSLNAFKACLARLFPETSSAQMSAPIVPLAAPGQPPLVDFAHLDVAISGLSRTQLTAMYRRMHRAVASDLEMIWPRVVKAASSQDQGQLADALHALKGCFSTLGWSRITGYCAAAMRRARAQQFTEWSTFPDELQKLYAASTAEMTRYLATAGSGESVAPEKNGEAGKDR